MKKQEKSLCCRSEEQRSNCEISGGGTGLHWDEIDEDFTCLPE
ncbi:MAG TPA: DUF2442 domain-containing protein [Nitrospirota bacterium]|nr:DUF2442 domain-containing protein [Nitrospirota bacterium]